MTSDQPLKRGGSLAYCFARYQGTPGRKTSIKFLIHHALTVQQVLNRAQQYGVGLVDLTFPTKQKELTSDEVSTAYKEDRVFLIP